MNCTNSDESGPNISISLGLGIGQIAQILPGKTPDTNTTILHYVAPEKPKNKEEIAELDHFMNFLRDVVNDEDYALGLEIQRGLDSNSKENVIFGKNERGNQFFHKYVDFFINEKITNPTPEEQLIAAAMGFDDDTLPQTEAFRPQSPLQQLSTVLGAVELFFFHL